MFDVRPACRTRDEQEQKYHASTHRGCRSRNAKTVVVARDASARHQYERGVLVNVTFLCYVPDFHDNSWLARMWTKHVRMVFFCVSVYIFGNM